MTQAYTCRFSEVHEVPAALQIHPQLMAAGFEVYGWVNMAHHQRAAVILSIGELPPFGGALLALAEAKDASGLDAVFIGDMDKYVYFDQVEGDSNEMSVIELRTEEMDINNGYTHLGFVLYHFVDDTPLTVVSLLGASNNPAVPTGGWSDIVD